MLVSNGYYSNFDKDHFIDFHRVQCNEPTPLVLDILFFFLISTKYAAVMARASSTESMTDGIHDGPVIAYWSENANYFSTESA